LRSKVELLPDDRCADWAAEPRVFVNAALALAQERLAGGKSLETLAAVWPEAASAERKA
jgi:hypothetical protein